MASVVGGSHELTVWDINSAKLEKRIATRAERIISSVRRLVRNEP